MSIKNEYLETKTFTLRTLSPIHIRAGEGSKDYGQGFIRINSDFVYLIDTPALQRELFNAGGLAAVQVFADSLSSPNSDKNIIDVLSIIKNKFGFDYKKNIEKISKGIVPTPKGNILMRSALGELLIPGSSIKGAIKTAVLYNILNDQKGTDKIENVVDRQIREYHKAKDKNKYKETLGKELLIENYQSIEPLEEVINPQRNPSGEISFKDYFRSVKIKDGMIEKNNEDKSIYGIISSLEPKENKVIITTVSNEKIILPIENCPLNRSIKVGQKVKVETTEKMNGKVIATFVSFVDEYILNKVELHDVMLMSLNKDLKTYNAYQFKKEENPHGKKVIDNRIQCFEGETFITISLDHYILDSFFKRNLLTPPFKDLDSLLNLCKTFADRQWQEELDYLTKYIRNGDVNLESINKFYDNNKGNATLRIGWGTGMLGTTLGLLLKPDRRKELRNRVISVQKAGQINSWPLPAPKSRRFVLGEDGNPLAPLGWVQLLETN